MGMIPESSMGLGAAAERLVSAANGLDGAGWLGPASRAATSLSLGLGDGRAALLPPTVGRASTGAVLVNEAAARHPRFGIHAGAHQRGVGAVVVTQPVALSALALRGTTVARCLLGLGCLELDAPPEPGALAEAIGDLVTPASRCVLLGRFGAVVWGDDLTEATGNLALLVQAARATLDAGPAPGQSLSEREVGRWCELLAGQGWPPAAAACADCNACPNGHRPRGVGEGRGEHGEQAAVEAAVADLLRT